MKPPLPNEQIYDCGHSRACGAIASVMTHVVRDGLDHFVVREHFYGRQLRVKRDTDGRLREIEIVSGELLEGM
jgi:hypothetical protein